MKNGIIIPCYNESSRLDIKSYLDYANNNKDTLLCFVNDGSSDATRATLAELKDIESDNIHVYSLSENGGKAKAVQEGALYLYNETEVETIGFIDADLSTDFNDYQRLVDTFHGNENIRVVYGSRAESEGNTIERNPVRALISKIIRLLILFITRLNIQDTQCGAKVFDRELIPTLFTKRFKTRWLFDVEILLRLKQKFGVKNFRSLFIEQPLLSWVHMDGSKLGAKDAIKIPMNLISIWYQYNIVDQFYRGLVEYLKVSLMQLHFKSITITGLLLLAAISEVNQFSLELTGLNYLEVLLPSLLFIYAMKTLVQNFILKSRKIKWINAHLNTYRRRVFNTIN